MSADLEILVFDPAKISIEEVVECQTRLPGIMDEWEKYTPQQLQQAHDRHSVLYDKLWATTEDNHDLVCVRDQFWVGQVSWLKGELSGQSYVPAVVQHVADYYASQGGVVLLSPDTVEEIVSGFDLDSNSVYEQDRRMRGIADKGTLREELMGALGEWTFVESM